MHAAPLESGLDVTQVERHVVRHEDGVSQESQQVLGQAPAGRGIGHHGIIDPGQSRDACGNRSVRTYEVHPAVELLPPIVKNGRNLRDVLTIGGTTVGLDVDDDELERCGRHGSNLGVRSAVDLRC